MTFGRPGPSTRHPGAGFGSSLPSWFRRMVHQRARIFLSDPTRNVHSSDFSVTNGWGVHLDVGTPGGRGRGR